jgi:hypothetical protein
MKVYDKSNHTLLAVDHSMPNAPEELTLLAYVLKMHPALVRYAAAVEDARDNLEGERKRAREVR